MKRLLGRLRQVVKGSENRRFLYDGDAPVVEYSAAGSVLRRHIHGDGLPEPLVTLSITTPAGTTTYSTSFPTPRRSLLSHLSRSRFPLEQKCKAA